MNSAEFFLACWKLTTKENLLDLLDTVPHRLRWFNAERNNTRSVENTTNPYSAMIEGLTNAYDGCIVDWRNQSFFNPMPINVHEALAQIAKGPELVHVYYHGTSTCATVTICDQGSGMTEEQLIAGPLSTGSDSKNSDPHQHGHYGHGGACLMGHSRASMTVSRTRGSNIYTFTMSFKYEPEDQTEPATYVYVTKPDGSLFSFAAHEIKFTEPHGDDHIATIANSVILPEHGTLRRQYEMKGVTYYQTTASGASLYTALQDKMFGSSGTGRLLGNKKPQSNKFRGRRMNFDHVPVGGKLEHTGAEMKYKIPFTPVMLFDKKTKKALGTIQIAMWLIGGWGDGKKPLKDMLDGRDSAAVFVTLAGQEHRRLRTLVPLRRVFAENLVPYVIMEVKLDDLPRDIKSVAVTSTRSQMNDDFEHMINEELINFLQPYKEDLMRISDEMDAKSRPVDEKEMQKIMSELHPLFNLLQDMGMVGQKPKPGTTVKGGDGETQSTTQPVAREPKRHAIFVPVDPPTKLQIDTSTVCCNRTEYITIKTDAADKYASKIRIQLPPHLGVVPGAKAKLRNGRVTLPCIVQEGHRVGSVGDIKVSLLLEGGEMLLARRRVTVVTRTAKDKLIDQKADEKDPTTDANTTGSPKIEIIDIPGFSSDAFEGAFGAIKNEEDASFSWRLKDDGAKLVIYVNTKFGFRNVVRSAFRKNFPTAAETLTANFLEDLTKSYTRSALISLHSPVFQGGDTAPLLTEMARGKCGDLIERYFDIDYRRSIMKRVKSVEE